ncbi:DNA translocase FtsK [Paenibacillus sp. LHD-117]|uniref:FtsK/SpoIIIE family DNA translocase n=1 Tax=Paenibacillus sp. LHD-117 TaxID=3071412 RepID=UPI0027DFA5BC|nr:DNA translocase FtsK 4TM domain-containing protein [Paenibacillus sp. LHD-117]MDQ6419195.1 DNA translocase FtsK [Paenibacillus sp. LHD-117]
MAKKKGRKKSIGAQLKYEVYGILIITVSIIALSGEATVGRALSKLFGLFLGKFYFVLALVGIYIGLTVMVKRAWPRGWTNRRTGLLILVLAFTLSSSISDINARFQGVERETLSGGVILGTLSQGLQDQLLSSSSEGVDEVSIQDKPISGGYVGALLFAMLFSLFGYYGAIIIDFVMFAISLMLITGKSYVELMRLARARFVRMVKLLNAKRSSRKAKREAAAGAAAAAVQPGGFDDDGTIEDDDQYAKVQPKKRKSLFFSWRHDDDETKDGDQDEDEWELSRREEERSSQPQNSAWESGMDHQPWEKTGEAYTQTIGNSPTDSDDDLPPWAQHDDRNDDAIDANMQGQRSSMENSELPEQGWGDPDWVAPHGNDIHDDRSVSELPMDLDPTAGGEDEFEDESRLASLRPEDGSSDQSEAQAAPRRPIGEDSAASGAVPAPKPYRLPPFTLLQKPVGLSRGSDATDMYDSRRKLEATLESFGVRAKVLDVVRGPAVTRYEVQPATGVKVSRIVGLTDDIALALAAKDVRMEAPIPGKSAIGIEVPNMEVSVVTMREVMETPAFQSSASKLSIAFGRDISGQTIVGNLARMPHLLVAGATGSGKSVCINGIITSILYKAKPDEVKFLMIDPKMVELNVYNGIPHLLAPVVTDPRRASLALKKIVVEMEKRYELFSKSSTRNIEGYNTLMADNLAAVLPYIVVIVDELADLMMVAANDVEDSIARLAQMARAAGIHLIIATQRPSVDVITGVIKANIPSRIAFGVSSQVDSRTILDMAGAEKLLGRGDMLFLPVGMSKPIRVQGAFLSDQEVEALVGYARDQGVAEYKEDLVPEIDTEAEGEDMMLDELFDQAVQIVVEAKQASVSLLQRRMRVGYTRAARLIDQMEARSIVGPYEGSKPREVLMSLEQFQASRISS